MLEGAKGLIHVIATGSGNKALPGITRGPQPLTDILRDSNDQVLSPLLLDFASKDACSLEKAYDVTVPHDENVAVDGKEGQRPHDRVCFLGIFVAIENKRGPPAPSGPRGDLAVEREAGNIAFLHEQEIRSRGPLTGTRLDISPAGLKQVRKRFRKQGWVENNAPLADKLTRLL